MSTDPRIWALIRGPKNIRKIMKNVSNKHHKTDCFHVSLIDQTQHYSNSNLC